ncbi:hypothetical protein H4684_003337 [Desulfomicrobium macestii]|uniref:Uncharacterized protein n=1 Tax=Desulfomicrobium macestii TaxID=90731 RepID=A0ABR9H7I0_9BACT|nr:hypothetical protein [Desulfomicrobium macestii]MBE1426671.1 hypothetical protein [Desulfomicrobium macestii]
MDDGQANDAWLSQTVGATQTDQQGSLVHEIIKIPGKLLFPGDFSISNESIQKCRADKKQ